MRCEFEGETCADPDKGRERRVEPTTGLEPVTC